MAIHFNHTILSARDGRASATFLAEMLGLPAPTRWGPFHMVTTENGANLDYMNTERRDHPAALRVPDQQIRIRPDFRPHPQTEPSLLG